jgi:hypothetical protein
MALVELLWDMEDTVIVKNCTEDTTQPAFCKASRINHIDNPSGTMQPFEFLDERFKYAATKVNQVFSVVVTGFIRHFHRHQLHPLPALGVFILFCAVVAFLATAGQT